MEVRCDIIPQCCGWSKNLTQLDSYMRSGKQFVRAGLVMAPDPCGLVDATGRVKCLRKPFLY